MGVLKDFVSRMFRRAIPYRGFGTEDELRSWLENKNYVVMTAQNPRLTPSSGPFAGSNVSISKSMDDPANESAIRQMMRSLDEQQLEYTVQKGAYGGDPELSLIVWSNDQDDDFFNKMQILADQYGQEALILADPEVRTEVKPRSDVAPEQRDYYGKGIVDSKDFGNITPVGKEFEEQTGRAEDKIDLNETVSGDGFRWLFEQKKWHDLTSGQQSVVLRKVKSAVS